MKGWRVTAIGVLVAGMMMALGSNPGMAAPRAHVYLLRGLLNIFSLGMDTLADELNRRGVYATVDNHADWESLANSAAANYKAGKEGPIIIIGHSLGADAAMEMANYLGARGVPVAFGGAVRRHSIVFGGPRRRPRAQSDAARLRLYAARTRL
jgi:hypothetical protein